MDTPHPHFPSPDDPRDPVHLSSLTRLMERADLPPGPDARVAVIDGATVIAVRPGLDRATRLAAVRQALAHFRRRRLLAFPILGAGWLRHHALAAGSAAAATASAAVIAAVVVTSPAAVPPHTGIGGPLGPAPAASQAHQPPASQPARRGHTAPGIAGPGGTAAGRTHAGAAVPVPSSAPSPRVTVSVPVPVPSGAPTLPPVPRPSQTPTLPVPTPSAPLPTPSVPLPHPSPTKFPNLNACLKVYSLAICIQLGY